MNSKFARVLAVSVVAGALFFLPTAAAAQGHVHFLGGMYTLNDDDETDPLDDLTQVGAQVSFGPADWPVMLAVDLLFATGDDSTTESGGPGFSADIDIELDVTELAVGVRKIWGESSARPFIGGGLDFVQADATFDVTFRTPLGSVSFDEDEDDNAIGLWVQGGVFWRLGSRFELGGQVRYNTAEVEADGEDIDVGGFGYGVILGWGWD